MADLRNMLAAEGVRAHLRKTMRSIHALPYFSSIRSPEERKNMDKILKEYIFRYLYYLITLQGNNYDILFPEDYKGKIDGKFNSKGNRKKAYLYEASYPYDIEEATVLTEKILLESEPYYSIGRTVKTSGLNKCHEGRSCGDKFSIGDLVYRCEECGLDNTCVLCSTCYYPPDHQDHHVSIKHAKEYTSGICDCGDVEAWKTGLHCKALEILKEKPLDNNQPIDSQKLQELTNNLELVITEVLDHFIDVFNQNIEPIPIIKESITDKLRDMVQRGKYCERTEFLNDLVYKNEHFNPLGESEINDDKNSPQLISRFQQEPENYTVMVYNDEYHDYPEAILAVTQGVPDDKDIKGLTSKIDQEGRVMLKCSRDLSSLMGGFFAVQSNGLSATLTSWSEFIHQETSKYIICWLLDCLKIPNSIFQDIFRETLSKVLSSKNENNNSVDMTNIIDKSFSELLEEGSYKYTNLSVLDVDKVIPLGHHKKLKEEDLDYISNLFNETYPVLDIQYANSRLQHILFFENRYWKRLRKDVQDLIIPTLSSDMRYKTVFCDQFVEIYNHVMYNMAHLDREPQLTAMTECVVQLFSYQSNANNIVLNNQLEDIIWSCFDLFKEYCVVKDNFLVWQTIDKRNPTNSIQISFKQGLHSIETILSKVTEPNAILHPRNFIPLVTLCKIFSNTWDIQRKVGDHVLHENREFVAYLEYTFTAFNVIDVFKHSIEINQHEVDRDILINALRLLCSLLTSRPIHFNDITMEQELSQFKISRNKVAYVHPIHTLFSILIEYLPLEVAVGSLDEVADFFQIAYYSLRTIVLFAQVEESFWVRNGSIVSSQCSYYKKHHRFDLYHRDIHMNQLSLIWNYDSSPEDGILNILSVWELLDWYLGKVKFEETVYEENAGMIVKQFVSFIYRLLSEKSFFEKAATIEGSRSQNIRESVIYNLFSQPISYTQLIEQTPEYFTKDLKSFDRILEEVSDYTQPKVFDDVGLFKLKENIFSEIDPLKLANINNDFESSVSILKKHLAKNKSDISNMIVEPQLGDTLQIDDEVKKIGRTLTTKTFAKLVYKLLQVCIESANIYYVYELLHLLHGIFKDNEYLDKDNSIPEAFLSIPVANQLFTIVTSKSTTFSEDVKGKANFLLKYMISRKPRDILESLTDSFGQECVNSYNSTIVNDPLLTEDAKEKKRRMAKKRQKKLLAKFNNQQSKFMKEHKEELIQPSKYDPQQTSMGDNVTSHENDICSLCQDEASTDLNVTVGYNDYSPIFMEGDIEKFKEFGSKWGTIKEETHIPEVSLSKLEYLKESSHDHTKMVFVSCNHIFHARCIEEFIKKKNYKFGSFICPLCQTVSNCYLPIFKISPMKSKILFEELIHGDISIDMIVDRLDNLSTIDVKNIYNITDKIFNEFKSSLAATNPLQNATIQDFFCMLAVYWTNTLSMLEISSRIDEEANKIFLEGRDQKYKTLKNILISISVMCYSTGKPNDAFLVSDIGKAIFAGKSSVVQYVTNITLFYDEHLSRTFSAGISEFVYQFVVNIFKSGIPNHMKKTIENLKKSGEFFQADSDFVSTIKAIWDNQNIKSDHSTYSDDVFNFIYTSLVKNIAPVLRRNLILIKVFYGIMNNTDSNPFINGVDIMDKLDADYLPNFVDEIIKLITYESDSLSSVLKIFVQNKNEAILFKREGYLGDIAFEFCGLVKLVNLESSLNTYLVSEKKLNLYEMRSKKLVKSINKSDYKICLTCGLKINTTFGNQELKMHLSNYCFEAHGLFLVPSDSEVLLFLSNPSSQYKIPAPYINSHGETGKNAMARGEIAKINWKRYEYLNRLWVNNEIPGYISRVMGEQFALNLLSNQTFFPLNNLMGGGAQNIDPELNNDVGGEEIPFNAGGIPEGGIPLGFVPPGLMPPGMGDINFGPPPVRGPTATTTVQMNIDGNEANPELMAHIFQNFQTAVANGLDPADPDIAVPFLRFLGAEVHAVQVRRTANNDDDTIGTVTGMNQESDDDDEYEEEFPEENNENTSSDNESSVN